MSEKKEVWHYPPELPQARADIIWVSDCYGKYAAKCGTWNPKWNGGKNTGTNIIKWAYMRDIVFPYIYEEWKRLDGRQVIKMSQLCFIHANGDGTIYIDGIRYKKA